MAGKGREEVADEGREEVADEVWGSSRDGG